MKKIYLISIIFSFCSFAVSNSGYSQTTSKRQNVLIPETLSVVLKLNDSSNYELNEIIYLNKVNVKAIRHFKKTFRDISNEKWYPLSNGYLAEFTANTMKNMVVYDRSGSWQFTICFYGELSLPSEVGAIIKPTYYDYSISAVQEVHVYDKTIYLVHLQNTNSLKTIRVCDGEMELLEDFKRQ